METKMPCIDCICFPICQDQDSGELLYKCSILKKYMSSSFYHFDMGYAFINNEPLPKKEDYQ